MLGKPSEQGSQEENVQESAESSNEDLLRKTVSSLRNCLHLIGKSCSGQEDMAARNKMVEGLFNCSIISQE